MENIWQSHEQTSLCIGQRAIVCHPGITGTQTKRFSWVRTKWYDLVTHTIAQNIRHTQGFGNIIIKPLFFCVLQYLTSQDVFFFWSLDLLSEYRIQHGTIGPLDVTSRHLTSIFYRGVSGFATDCLCGVWCRELTTCLLYVCLLFRNRLLNNNWAVGLI